MFLGGCNFCISVIFAHFCSYFEHFEHFFAHFFPRCAFFSTFFVYFLHIFDPGRAGRSPCLWLGDVPPFANAFQTVHRAPLRRGPAREAVQKLLLGANKTVVMVTHQWQYLRYAQQVLLMKNTAAQAPTSLPRGFLGLNEWPRQGGGLVWNRDISSWRQGFRASFRFVDLG